MRSCRDLNEAASLGAAGFERRLAVKHRVLESLARCEASALAAGSAAWQRYLRNDACVIAIGVGMLLRYWRSRDGSMIPVMVYR